MESLSIVRNYQMVFRAGEGAGRSGSFFFFSYDNRFLIKTLQGEEKRKLLNMMNLYIKHIKETNNESLIARIYGVFTFMTNQYQPVDVVIMQNTAHLYDESFKKFSFDLKGSTVGRRVAFNPKLSHRRAPLLKDINFQEIENLRSKCSSRYLVNISSENHSKILSIIKQDSDFLSSQGIMDYSLLLVQESIDKDFLIPSGHGQLSINGY